MDQLYFEDGYYEGKYFVYTASALAGFTPYIDAGYLDVNFFEDKSGAFTLTCEITRVRYIAFDASLASSFTQTTTANKDARTTITLSTIANVSAQAMKLRELSSSLSVVSTQTAPASKTARATAAWTSAFSPTIVANASVSNGSDLSTSFTLSAQAGVRRQFPLNQLTGLGTTSSQYGTIDFNQSLFPGPVGNGASIGVLSARRNYWTFSAWVKRDTVNSEFQTIAEGLVQEQTGGATLNNGGIVLKNSDVRIRFNYDPDEPGANWQGVAPTDTEWHHYLFRSIINPANDTYPVESWRLWIDGVYQGSSTSYFAASDLEFAGRYGSQQGTLYGGLRLGFGLIARSQGSYEIVASPLLGGVAQVWMGITTDSQFRLERFYSGLLDLGSDGTGTGLPTPVFYNPLTTPYTGVTLNPGAEPVPSPASTPLGLPSVQSRFSLTGEASTVIITTSTLASQFTLQVVTGLRSSAEAALSTEFTQSATAIKTVGVSSALTVSTTVSITSQRVRFGASALSAAATLTADIIRVKPFSASLSSQTAFTATAFRQQPGLAQLTARFTVNATIDDRTRDAIALEAGVSTLTVDYTRIRKVSGALSSSATVSSDYIVIKPAGSAMTAQFTVIADAKKVIVNTANLVNQFTLTGSAFKAVIASAHIQVEGFQLTQGDILNFDPCREIQVDEETRNTKVLPESRSLIVESETRTLKVAQETRVLKVDFETRVNIIQC